MHQDLDRVRALAAPNIRETRNNNYQMELYLRGQGTVIENDPSNLSVFRVTKTTKKLRFKTNNNS